MGFPDRVSLFLPYLLLMIARHRLRDREASGAVRPDTGKQHLSRPAPLPWKPPMDTADISDSWKRPLLSSLSMLSKFGRPQTVPPTVPPLTRSSSLSRRNLYHGAAPGAILAPLPHASGGNPL